MISITNYVEFKCLSDYLLLCVVLGDELQNTEPEWSSSLDLPSLAFVFVPPIQDDCWVCSHPCIHARPNCYISQLLDDGMVDMMWLT